MGRQQYLTRLALGRSAFEDLESPPSKRVGPAEQGVRNSESGGDDYVQQFDHKGRPFNPATEAANAELRTAQNNILALVGVVEKKDESDRQSELQHRSRREQRQKMLEHENDVGEILDCAFNASAALALPWTDAFIKRVLVGFYDPQLSMAQILSYELNSLWSGGLKLILARCFPAIGGKLVSPVVKFQFYFGIEQAIGRLQILIQRRRFSRNTTRRLYHLLGAASVLAFLFIDVVFLPVELYADAQRLGLAPLLPLFPPVKAFQRTGPDSYHTYLWEPLLDSSPFHIFKSTGLIYIARTLVLANTQAPSFPLCNLLTRYRYPPVNAHPSLHATSPRFRSDPVGYIMHQTWRLRAATLHSICNWTLTRRMQLAEHDRHAVESNIDTRSRDSVYRSTELAHLVPATLSWALRDLAHRLLLLPLDAVYLRCVARTWMASPVTPKTLGATTVASRLFYAPFGGGPPWTAVGTYLSHLGLAFAIRMSMHTVLFFGAYGVTRYLGTAWFGWKGKETPVARLRRVEGKGERRSSDGEAS